MSVEASCVLALDQVVGAGFCCGGGDDALVCWVSGGGDDGDERCGEEMEGFHAVNNSKTLSYGRMKSAGVMGRRVERACISGGAGVQFAYEVRK